MYLTGIKSGKKTTVSSIKEKISSLGKNRDAKTIVGNFAWLSALQVASYAFPLITMPYLAQVIGVEGFGKIAFASAIVFWIQIISEWGFNQTATRDLAQNRDNPQQVSEIFSNTLWARILLMLVCFIILVVLILTIPKFKENWTILLVTFLSIPGHILFPDWFFQAIEKMKYISVLNIFMKLFFTVMVFIFINDKNDYILQPLFISLGFFASGVIAMYIILCKWHVKIYTPQIKTIISYIKDSADVFINNVAPNLYSSFSQILLGIMGCTTANGIYEGGNKFYQITSNLLSILTRTFFPFLSRKPEKHNIFVLITMGASILVAILLYVLAPFLTQVILSAEFADSIIVIRIFAVSLIFVMLYNCYGMCFLIIHKKEKILRQITIAVSICGFLISWFLVNKYSYIGAALTVAICRMLLGIITFIAAKRVQNALNR